MYAQHEMHGLYNTKNSFSWFSSNMMLQVRICTCSWIFFVGSWNRLWQKMLKNDGTFWVLMETTVFCICWNQRHKKWQATFPKFITGRISCSTCPVATLIICVPPEKILLKSISTSVWDMGCTLGSWSYFLQEQEVFLLSRLSRLTLGAHPT